MTDVISGQEPPAKGTRPIAVKNVPAGYSGEDGLANET